MIRQCRVIKINKVNSTLVNDYLVINKKQLNVRSERMIV